MEVAVVSHSEATQAVGIEELYDEYLSTFKLDSGVPNKSPEAVWWLMLVNLRSRRNGTKSRPS